MSRARIQQWLQSRAAAGLQVRLVRVEHADQVQAFEIAADDVDALAQAIAQAAEDDAAVGEYALIALGADGKPGDRLRFSIAPGKSQAPAQSPPGGPALETLVTALNRQLELAWRQLDETHRKLLAASEAHVRATSTVSDALANRIKTYEEQHERLLQRQFALAESTSATELAKTQVLADANLSLATRKEVFGMVEKAAPELLPLLMKVPAIRRWFASLLEEGEEEDAEEGDAAA